MRLLSVAVATHLRFDQDQVDKQHDEIVLDVLVAEAAAVLAHRQPDVVATRLVAAALAPERLDGVPALYADGHGRGGRGGISFGSGWSGRTGFGLGFEFDRSEGRAVDRMQGSFGGAIGARWKASRGVVVCRGRGWRCGAPIRILIDQTSRHHPLCLGETEHP